MPVVRRPGALRSLTVAAAVAVSLLAVPSTASADDEPGAGDTVVGTLVQAWPDPSSASDEAPAEPLTWVEPEDGDAVRIVPDDLPDDRAMVVGATVRVRIGERVADDAAREAGLATAHAVLSASVVSEAPEAPAPVPGTAAAATTEAVTVVMVQPPGVAADSTTAAQVVSMVNTQVQPFWSEQSGGTVKVVATAPRPAYLRTQAGCSDPLAMWAEAANHVGWKGTTWHTHLMVYVAAGADCAAVGLGEVGYSIGLPTRFYVQSRLASVTAHELGHNFGLGHSSLVHCDGVVDSSTGYCGVSPYDDLYDVMGYSWQQIGSLSAPQADLLGLLPASAVATVETFGPAGTRRLQPLGTRTGTRALQLVTRDEAEYWLEYRTATGRDAYLGTSANLPGLQTGVLLRVGTYGDDTSLLFDGSPSAQGGWASDLQTALPVGSEITIADGEFTIEVTASDAGGADVTVTPSGYDAAVHVRYRQAGGPDSWLGWPLADEECGLTGGGCQQAFEGGSIVWSPATGARLMNGGALTDWWSDRGGPDSPMGYPVADVDCGLAFGGCFQRFQTGWIYQSPTGTVGWVEPDAVRDRWGALGWELGPLGYPVGQQACGLKNGGCYSAFQRGLIYTSAAGTRATWGAVRDRYAAWGYETGRLGYPTRDPVCTLVRGGCFQLFQGGSVYWSATTGARVVLGAIRDRWGTLGWEAGAAGYPTADEVCGLRDGGCFQSFQGGSIYWSSRSGAQPITGAIRTAWGAQGWERGSLGYPLTAEYPIPGGRAQRFQGGYLTWFAATNRVVRS